MKINLVAYEPFPDIGVETQHSYRWGLTATQDLDLALAQPFRIIIVPAFCDQPQWYQFNPAALTLDWSQFDLVLINEFEVTPASHMRAWANTLGLKNYLIGSGWWLPEYDNQPDVVVHPFALTRLIYMNSWQDTGGSHKKYLFDALLGYKRPHRDYIMYQMQNHPDIMRKTFLAYHSFVEREPEKNWFATCFPECKKGRVDLMHNRRDTPEAQILLQQLALDPNKYLQQRFVGCELERPYLTKDPDIENREISDGQESRWVPWDIFRHSYFSIVAETMHDASGIFLTEKIGKPLYAGRLFVIFAAKGTLARLKTMGFETFSSVIDESYDQETDLYRRWDRCWDQIKYLSEQSPEDIIRTIQPILDHNTQLISRIIPYVIGQSHDRLRSKIPERYIQLID